MEDMDELITINELCDEEPSMNPDKYYRGARAGVLPVIQTGPEKGFRMTRGLWSRFKRGEEIPSRYFLRKNTA